MTTETNLRNYKRRKIRLREKIFNAEQKKPFRNNYMENISKNLNTSKLHKCILCLQLKAKKDNDFCDDCKELYNVANQAG